MQAVCERDTAPEQRVVTAAMVEHIFNAVFHESHQTVLQGGASEPVYMPAQDERGLNRICYREDFVSSSLHEVAHWLVAGEARRRLPDWGYWYAPDGRTEGEQALFEQVEVKPQAIEWLLHKASGLQFRVSLDNLGQAAGDGQAFRDAVFTRACAYIAEGVNLRTQHFYTALAVALGGPPDWRQLRLMREELDI